MEYDEEAKEEKEVVVDEVEKAESTSHLGEEWCRWWWWSWWWWWWWWSGGWAGCGSGE